MSLERYPERVNWQLLINTLKANGYTMNQVSDGCGVSVNTLRSLKYKVATEPYYSNAAPLLNFACQRLPTDVFNRCCSPIEGVIR